MLVTTISFIAFCFILHATAVRDIKKARLKLSSEVSSNHDHYGTIISTVNK